MWDIPGGHVEESETPEQCIVREMKEEMGIDLKGFHFFSVMDFADRTEYIFWKKANFNIDQIQISEGQCMKWFTEKEARATELAYGFNQVIEAFFDKIK